MICFVSKYAFEYSELLRIYFMKIMDYDICFKQKKACNIFRIDRPSVLGMVLLTELTTHLSSLLFADQVPF